MPFLFHASAMFRSLFTAKLRACASYRGKIMAEEFFDVQAALLYDEMPAIDLGTFADWFIGLAQDYGLPGTYEVLAGATNETMLTLAGAGLHVTVTVQSTPCDPSEFALALRAPILRHKKFDFKAAIRAHQSAVVITVGDGETPLPVDVREKMAMAGVVQPSDPTLKLSVLHVLMQCMAMANRPTMVSFCPSQSLLCPQELAAVSGRALPYPILFHPFPFSNGKTDDGQPRIGMAAIHAARLIGAELELENIPTEMPVATRINLLATLIQNKRSGSLALADGDGLQPDGEHTLIVRHEPGSTEDGPHRIVATFVDPPAQAGASGDPKGHQDFQDRIARLKERGVQTGEMTTPSVPLGGESAESPDDLRARVQETISPGGHGPVSSGFLSGPIKLVVIAAFLGFFFVLGPTDDVAEMASSQASSISTLMQTLSASEVTPTDGTTTGATRNLEANFRSVTTP